MSRGPRRERDALRGRLREGSTAGRRVLLFPLVVDDSERRDRGIRREIQAPASASKRREGAVTRMADTPEAPAAPLRTVHCGEALEWLRAQPVLAGHSFITSLPDVSELG